MSRIINNPDAQLIIFDLALSDRHSVIIGGNRTLTLNNVIPGQTFYIRIVQDSTGGRRVTWWPGINWAGGVEPSLTVTPGKTDAFQFLCVSAGVYDGFVTGQNL